MHVNATGRFRVVHAGTTLFVAIAAILSPSLPTHADESCPPFWSVKDLAGRGWHAMAYDSRRDVTVMFGGASGQGETREWNGSDWVLVSTSGPIPRYYHAMAYDEARGVTVLFGGLKSPGTPIKYLADTWEWDGSTWTLRDKDGPEQRAGHAMAYDSSRGAVVLFGGSNPEGALGDTWEWDGRRWMRVADTGPSARSSHGFTYDRSRDRIVLFGGYQRSEPYDLADTWEWDGMSWEAVSESGPLARGGHALVYDHDRGVSVMFGGYASARGSRRYFSDTWEWDGTNWIHVEARGPSDRNSHAMVYDTQQRVCLLFGGMHFPGPRVRLGDTWSFDGSEWVLLRPDSSPALRYGHRMVFDSWRGVCVVAGGSYGLWRQFSDVWLWDGRRWEERATSLDRVFHAMAFDSRRGVAVLTGGMTGDVVMSDTWEWDGSRWRRSLATGPGSMDHVMTFDSKRGVVVMLNTFGETHEYDGRTWTFRTDDGPPPRANATMAFDSRSGVTVLFGGEQYRRDYGDTWEWDGDEWAFRSDTGPDPRYDHAMAYDEVRAVTVVMGGRNQSYESLRDTWEWDGTSWMRGPDLQMPHANHAMAYDSTRGVIVSFSGSWDAETWELAAVPGDCDCDRRVDLGDFVVLADCLLGPDEMVPPQCACSDVTRDGDVDLEDFVRMQVPFGAPPPP